MLKTLIKIQLTNTFGSLGFRSNNKKKPLKPVTKVLIGLLVVYLLAVFAFMFIALFAQFAEPLHECNATWLYFSIAAFMSLMFMCLTGAMTSYATLYGAKDNELLLSLPIPPNMIVIARLITTLLINSAFNLLVCLPALLIYVVRYPLPITGIICFAVLFLILPLLGLAISYLIGWLIGLIASRARNKTVVSVIFTLVFIGVYLVVYINFYKYITLIISNAALIAQVLQSAYPPLLWFGNAVAAGNMLHLLLSVALIVAPAFIVYAVLSKNFIAMATTKRGAAKVQYKQKAMKEASVSKALLRKELAHLLSSSGYLINSAFGALLMLIGAGALIIYGGKVTALIDSIPFFAEYASGMLTLMVGFMIGTIMVSAPSVSLEGKNLWIAQSLPVDSSKILIAKANMQLVFALPPTVILQAVLIAVMRPSFANAVMLVLYPLACNFLIAYAGVAVNLHLPKLDFTNETEVVKQSISVLITMLVGMAMVAVPGLLYFILLIKLMDITTFMLIITSFIDIAALLTYRYLCTKGARLFDSLTV